MRRCVGRAFCNTKCLAFCSASCMGDISSMFTMGLSTVEGEKRLCPLLSLAMMTAKRTRVSQPVPADQQGARLCKKLASRLSDAPRVPSIRNTFLERPHDTDNPIASSQRG